MRTFFSLLLFTLLGGTMIAQDCLGGAWASLREMDNSNPLACEFLMDICVSVTTSPRPKTIDYEIEYDSNNDGTLDRSVSYTYDPPGNNALDLGNYCLSDWGEEFTLILPCLQEIDVRISSQLNASGSNNDSCTEYDATILATEDGFIPLPVELTSFRASVDDDLGLLQWTTETEYNSSHFEIEKMCGDNEFEKIGEIESHHYTTQTMHYSFIDENLCNYNYYRLKMVDYDDSYEYSPIIFVEKDMEIKQDLSVYPNPARNDINIAIGSLQDEEVTIQVFNILGEMISHQNYQLTKGQNIFPYDVSKLEAGQYYVRTTNLSDVVNSQSFIVMK